MTRTSVFGILLALSIATAPDRQLNAQAPAVSALEGPAALDYWGTRFSTFGTAVFENSLRTQVRTTIAQLAMFDAVNAVFGGPYRPFVSTPDSAPGASPEAAAIHAGYVVALHEFSPTQTDAIVSAYQAAIVRVPGDRDAIEAGIEVGDAAAKAVLAERAEDRRNDPDLVGYTPASGPGAWIPTPQGSLNPQTPFLRFVTPFGYTNPARFRPDPPPPLDGRTYTNDYNEVTDIGRDTGTSRTAEESATALFWSPSASALWSANIRGVASTMDLLSAARFEAIGIAAVTNALIACWDAKYTYMFWRPVTAIRAGDTDGNPETDPDPAWTPFIVTPSHPEYPSAHTTVGGAALAFYAVWFDNDQFSLMFRGNGGVVRSYSSAHEILAEEGDARVWGGMHWRNSIIVGSALGRRIGRYTATHLLQPRDE